MTSREDIHRLVDAVPAARLPVIERLLQASLEQAAPTGRRRFASTGVLSDEPDLAERSEDVLRSETGPGVADERDDPSV